MRLWPSMTQVAGRGGPGRETTTIRYLLAATQPAMPIKAAAAGAAAGLRGVPSPVELVKLQVCMVACRVQYGPKLDWCFSRRKGECAGKSRESTFGYAGNWSFADRTI